MPYKIDATYMHSNASVVGFLSPEVQREGWPGHPCAMAARSPGVTGCMQPHSPQHLGAAQELRVPRAACSGCWAESVVLGQRPGSGQPAAH